MNKVENRYNMLIAIRDSLQTALAEISILKENEAVQRYIELQRHLEKYLSLEQLTDDQILEEVIKNDTSLENDSYFCYGHNLPGATKKIGTYYIREEVGQSMYIPVSKYRSIKDPNEIYILPFLKDKEFELEHHIIESTTTDPETEYNNLRKKLYTEQFKGTMLL